MSPYLIMFYVPKSVHFSVLQHLLHNNLLAVYYINALCKSVERLGVAAYELTVYRVYRNVVESLGIYVADGVRQAKTYETEACERHPLVLGCSYTTYTYLSGCVVFMNVEYNEVVVPSTVEDTTGIANVWHFLFLVNTEEYEVCYALRSTCSC